MDICEVYALNIQPNQIKKLLSTDKHNEQGIEEERQSFLFWLKEQYNLGMKYASQVDAWFWYKIEIVPLEDTEFEQEEPDWLSRLKFALEDKVLANAANYSEFGGQL